MQTRLMALVIYIGGSVHCLNRNELKHFDDVSTTNEINTYVNIIKNCVYNLKRNCVLIFFSYCHRIITILISNFPQSKHAR
jgi:hypothetical protein